MGNNKIDAEPGPNATSSADGESSPSVRLFLRQHAPCIAPGGAVVFGWRANPENAQTEIVISDKNKQIACLTNLTSSGEVEWVVPRSIAQSTELTVTVTAAVQDELASDSLFLWISDRPDLVITGMEITQGIQTYNRPDGTPDNSLDLISHKDTVVRVYISADFGGFNNDRVQDVTGTLEFDGTPLSPINGQSPDSCGSWSGGNPFITARPSDQVDRETTDHTLNFRIPAAMATAYYHSVDVRITSPEFCGETASRSVITIKFWPAGSLSIRYVRVRDDHPSTGTHTMPTDSEAACTIIRALDHIPSTILDIGPAKVTEHETNQDLNTFMGAINLANEISDLQLDCSWWEDIPLLNPCGNFKAGPIWVGVHNRGVGWAPSNHNVAVTVSFDPLSYICGINRVMAAHELGHRMGFGHVGIGCYSFCANIDPPQDATYDPANGGLLWDVPFDPFLNRTLRGDVGDFMSYDCPAWPSGDSWNSMRQIIG